MAEGEESSVLDVMQGHIAKLKAQEDEIKAKKAELETKENELREKEESISSRESSLSSKEEDLNNRESSLSEKESSISQKESELSSKLSEVESKISEVAGKVEEVNSAKERIALMALDKENGVRYIETLAIINAIIHLGNTLGAALSGGGSQSDGGSVKKMMDLLRTHLIPQYDEELQKKAKDVKAILEEELSKGPLAVQATDRPAKTKGRIRKRSKL